MKTIHVNYGSKIASKLMAILLLASAAYTCLAQDIITYKDGRKEKSKVTEVTSTEVRFKKFNNLNGPTYSADKSEILMIKYKNGSKDVFGDAASDLNSESENAPGEVASNPSADYHVNISDTRIKYNGPRIGLTMIGGGIASEFIKDRGKLPFVTQFGWQFETRIFTLQNGTSGVFEFVPLVGGIEQGMFLPSFSALFGIRSGKGFEVAAGPNLSLTGMGLVLAAGTSFRSGNVYFPVNLVVVPSVSRKSYDYDQYGNGKEITKHTGVRVSLLIGFNTRKD